jgi:hypothetical protein
VDSNLKTLNSKFIFLFTTIPNSRNSSIKINVISNYTQKPFLSFVFFLFFFTQKPFFFLFHLYSKAIYLFFSKGQKPFIKQLKVAKYVSSLTKVPNFIFPSIQNISPYFHRMHFQALSYSLQ